MKRVRVLVVDDSAFARKVIREVLSHDPELEVVGIARDGLEALEKAAELRPDVITLDLVMPELDGLGVLRALPKDTTAKVVVVSISPADSELAIEALQIGAVDLVTKPTALATDRLYELSSELVAKVKTAAAARARLGDAEAPSPKPAPGPPPSTTTVRLVAIGTSTGGPQALTRLFSALPAGLPVPFAIALHIPAGYTAPLASRLSTLGGMPIEEARDGMEVRPGRGVLAPGGMHLALRSGPGGFVAHVSREPLGTTHHPSVDVLFESAAEHGGSGALGLVLTGMGDDGLRGARAIVQAGGHVIAESAASCVVYGMPRSVIESGVAREQAPLERIPELLLDHIYSSAGRSGSAMIAALQRGVPLGDSDE